jgi:surface polysaccharide O-acyltransferase-like enzyme
VTNVPPPLPDERRHDYDALRGFAMLLGVVLHASLAYLGPTRWAVQDRGESFLLTFVWAFIHGWRMELFFVLAGYFTAMVLRRAGNGGMLRRRLRRLVVPFLLGAATVLPLTFWVEGQARRSGAVRGIAAAQLNEPIHQAVRRGDLAELKKIDPDDPELGNAQYLAAALGQTEALKILLKRNNDRPADTLLARLHGENALHAAARFGQPAAVELILDGARGRPWKTELLAAKNEAGQTAADLTARDEPEHQRIARILGVPPNADEARGRAEVLRLLDPGKRTAGLRLSPLLHQPLLGHLWFMWVLILLTVAFAAWAWLNERLDLPATPRWMLAEWTRLLWLLPVTTLLFWWSTAEVGFGIAGEMSLAEKPAAIVTYGLFFAFGAALRLRGNEPARWPWLAWIQLPFLTFIVLPIALGLSTWGQPVAHAIGCVLQAAFAWGMTFTLMDLFTWHLARPIAVVRRLADASLWVYLLHLPLVVALQWLMASWRLWPIVKCGLICGVTIGALLLADHFLVRRTWLGAWLNGR